MDWTPRQEEVRSTVLAKARYSLVYGGARSGKTFLLCAAIADRAVMAPGSRHLIIRKFNKAAVESIAKDTFLKVMELCWPGVPCKWHDRFGFFEIATNDRPSEVWIGGIDDPERFDKVLGKEYATIYMNEASELPYAIFSQLKTRLAHRVSYLHPDNGSERELNQRFYIDLNPTVRAHWTYQVWSLKLDPATGGPLPNPEQYRHDTMHPRDNERNLSSEYLEELQNMSPRERKRFWDGEYATEATGALWKREWIVHDPRPDRIGPDDFKRIVVSVDPAVSSKPGSDETGIIVVGLHQDGRLYVLDDLSGKYEPERWAEIAVRMYDEWEADKIIGEKNQGGDMIETIMRQSAASGGRYLPVDLVTATKGKALRAEPVSTLYARNPPIAVHLREFRELEDQMCAFTIDFDRKHMGFSPDRVDALVHGATYLLPRLNSSIRQERRRNEDPHLQQRGPEMAVFKDEVWG